MASTWSNAPTGAVFNDPVNSELYFAESRRNRWTEQGNIKRGNVASGPKFAVTGTGVRQRQAQSFGGAEGYQGARAGGASGGVTAGGFLSGAVDTVKGVYGEYKGYKQGQANAAAQAQDTYDKGVDMWAGTYQRGAQQAENARISQQRGAAWTTPKPEPASMPITDIPTYKFASINRSIAKAFPNAPKSTPLTDIPTFKYADVNKNLATTYPKAYPMVDNTQTDAYAPAYAPAQSRALKRQWSRPVGWK
jgi:hypothetical protein